MMAVKVTISPREGFAGDHVMSWTVRSVEVPAVAILAVNNKINKKILK